MALVQLHQSRKRYTKAPPRTNHLLPSKQSPPCIYPPPNPNPTCAPKHASSDSAAATSCPVALLGLASCSAPSQCRVKLGIHVHMVGTEIQSPSSPTSLKASDLQRFSERVNTAPCIVNLALLTGSPFDPFARCRGVALVDVKEEQLMRKKKDCTCLESGGPVSIR
ncbi:unnamed protein product [Natator depressus]